MSTKLKFYNTLFAIILFLIINYFIIWTHAIAVTLTILVTLDFLQSIGKKIPFLELVNLFMFLTCAAMPVVAYEIFNKQNQLAKLWVTYMPIKSDEYFEYVLPSCIAFFLGTKVVFFKRSPKIELQINNIKQHLINKKNIGLCLLITGLVSDIFVEISPLAIKNIIQNFSYLTYIGMFYVLYSPARYKSLVVLLCILITLAQSIRTGMYGELVYLSAMSTMILLGGKRYKTYIKFLIFSLGVILLLFIQSIKSEYREGTWGENLERKSDPTLFTNLVLDRLDNPSKIFESDRLFNASVRANQGNIIAKVLKYVPKHEPYAYGGTVIEAFLSAFIPRLIWPDKPKTGGADKVCRFLGDCESYRKGYSYNISPIGEAYVNFGKIGGVFFMFFYGLLFNYLFSKALQISVNTPTIILWFPLIFFSFFTMENDVLSFINAFIKSTFFCWLVYKSSNLIFKTKI